MSSPNTAITCFEQLDIVHPDLVFAPDETVVNIGGGLNSRVHLVGDEVLKISKRTLDLGAAKAYAETLKAEELGMAPYICDNMQFAEYLVVTVASEPDKSRVVAVQDFVPGITIAEFLKDGAADTKQLVDFYMRCGRMYAETKRTPDVACFERGFYNALSDHNVLISTDPQTPDKPILIDTNYGRLQRSRAFGVRQHALIASGTRRSALKLMRRQRRLQR